MKKINKQQYLNLIESGKRFGRKLVKRTKHGYWRLEV